MEQGGGSSAGHRLPWWHNAALVTVMTAMLGAMVPLAAGVQAYVQKERELALEREKHRQDIRLHYLDTLVSASLKDVEMFLSFISETDDNPDLKQWAHAQLGAVRGRISKLEIDLAAAEKRATEAQNDLAAAQRSADAKVREAQAQANASLAQKEKAQSAARDAQAALAEAQRRAATRRTEAQDTKAALSRPRPYSNSFVQQRAPTAADE